MKDCHNIFSLIRTEIETDFEVISIEKPKTFNEACLITVKEKDIEVTT